MQFKYKCTCCETVQGIRSPDALLPRDKLFIMVDLDISPSKHTCQLKKYMYHANHTCQ